jgi:hypothetical protein
MRTLLPVLDADPPAAYVDFVARNLTGLRSATLRAVADAHLAELLYPDVLTDVALAWPRLESARLHGRPQAANDYLEQCLNRRVYGEPDGEDGGQQPAAVEVQFIVWDAASSQLPHLPPPARENLALRLATQLLPEVEPEPAPVAEAAIAWWHAYELRRRRWRIFAAVAGLVVILGPLAVVSTSSASF